MQNVWRMILVMMAVAVRGALAAEVDVTKAGAVGDGKTLNTAALQKAIDDTNAGGGGVVRIPAGRYLTGTIQLKNNVTLHLDEKAVLLGSTKAEDYRNLDPFIDGSGTPMGYALLVAVDAKHVTIEGKGEIDGQGAAVKAGQAKYNVRPFLVRWVRSSDISVKDVTLRSSGAWGMHFSQCKNVAVSGLTIRNLGLTNNDGIDIDSCTSVHIEKCDIDSGDDAICLKATSTTACSDITVVDCKLKTRCNAIKMGTESIGDYERVRVSGCEIRETGMAGIALYDVDGAHMQDVQISDIQMAGVTVPVSIRLGARLKTFREGQTAKPVGTLRDVTIKNVKATGAKQIGMLINGVPGHNVEALTLENISIELDGGGKAEDAAVQLAEKESTYPEYNMFGKVMPAYGIYLRHADGVTFNNVKLSVVKADARPAMVQVDVKNVKGEVVAATQGAK